MSQFIPTSGLLVFTVRDTSYKVIMFTLGVLKGIFGIARVSTSTPTTDEMRWLLCSEKSPTFLSERKSS